MRIEGEYPRLERILTPLWSFDRAVGNPVNGSFGMPLRTLYELYGPPESGKSTLSYFLSSLIDPMKTILMASLEFNDVAYMRNVMERAGFQGTLEFIPYQDSKGKWLGHSKMLTDAVNRVGKDEDISAFILDSVAAIVPPAREENQLGEGYQTDRAKFLKDMCGRLESKLMNRETPCVFFAVNHVGQSLDPRNKARVTPGGTGLKFHGTVRIYLFRRDAWADPDTNMLKGFLAEGNVDKLRWGGRGRKFHVYIVPDKGIHLGMTALWDCVYAGIAKRTKTGYFQLQGENVGRIGQFVDAAFHGENEVFEPFHQAIAELDMATASEISDDEEPSEEL